MDIQQLAEIKYPMPEPNEYTYKSMEQALIYNSDCNTVENKRASYIDGLSHGLDIAERFAEWCDDRYYYTINGWVKDGEELMEIYHTTSQLLSQYLTEINNK